MYKSTEYETSLVPLAACDHPGLVYSLLHFNIMMDGNLAMLNWQQYHSEEELNQAEAEHHNYKLQLLLIDIVSNNPMIAVACPGMHDLVKEIYRDTGILISAQPVIDYYLTDDHWQNERKRINRREYYLTIKTEI